MWVRVWVWVRLESGFGFGFGLESGFGFVLRLGLGFGFGFGFRSVISSGIEYNMLRLLQRLETGTQIFNLIYRGRGSSPLPLHPRILP